MYVIIDLSFNAKDAEPWLTSLRDPAGIPVGVQRFPRIRSAALDITAAQLESGRARQLQIFPVEPLRIPSIEQAGDPVRSDKVPLDVPWNQRLIGIRDLQATGREIRVGHIDSGIDPDHPFMAGHPAAF